MNKKLVIVTKVERELYTKPCLQIGVVSFLNILLISFLFTLNSKDFFFSLLKMNSWRIFYSQRSFLESLFSFSLSCFSTPGESGTSSSKASSDSTY